MTPSVDITTVGLLLMTVVGSAALARGFPPRFRHLGGEVSQRVTRRGRGQRRSRREMERSLPMICEAIAREVRSGASPAGGLLAASRQLPDVDVTRTGLGSVASALERGVPVRTALADWGDLYRSPSLAQVIAVMCVADDVGGQSAGAFDHVARSLRDRVEVADEARALSAQARASAVLLTTLPPCAAFLLALIEPAAGSFLIGTAAGWACLLAAGLLLTVGWTWLRRLAGSADV